MKNDYLNKAATKLDICQTNNIGVEKAESEFLNALCEFANSDEFVSSAGDYMPQVQEAKNRLGKLSQIPYAALIQILNEEKKLIDEIAVLLDKEGLSANTKWNIRLFYVLGCFLENLRDEFDYDFDDENIGFSALDDYKGVEIDWTEDPPGYAKRWIKDVREMLNKMFLAIDNCDLSLQKSVMSNLFFLAVSTAYIDQ